MIKLSIYLPYITVSNTEVPLDDAILTDANTWYTISDAKLICLHCNKFSNVNGQITYDGPGNFGVLFIGTADIEVDKACRITFQLFKNGVAIPGIHSVKDFFSPAKIGTLAKAHGMDIGVGDVIEVKAKSSVALTTISVTTMSLVFKG